VVKISTSARSPLSLTRWPSDAFVWWRSLVVLFTLGAAFVVAQMLQLTWLSATHAHVDPRKLVLNWNILALQLAVYAPVLPALLTGLHWAAQRPLREVGMRLPTTFEATIGVTGGLAAYAITMAISLVQTALTHVRPEQQVVDALSGAHDPTIIAAFAFFACVLAPFVEETAFRGFLFNAIYRYTPLWLAAALSGLLFAMSHGSRSALVPLWAVGIILAFVYQRTGTLAASMIAHGTFNVTNVILIVAAHQTS